VGLVTFDEDVVDFVPPSAKHRDAVLHALDRLEGEGRPGRLQQPLLKAAEASRRRGMLAVISDLYEDPGEVLRATRQLAGRGSDVMVFHVLDPAERHFPYEESATWVDSESGETMPVVPSYVRDEYRRLIAEHIQALEGRLGESRIDYALLDTATPLDQALFRYLSRRERLSKGRR
jgi:hypothetical protein